MTAPKNDELYDESVADWMRQAAAEVSVDVEVEWLRLVDRLEREAQEVATIGGMPGGTTVAGAALGGGPSPSTSWSSGARLLAIAAVVLVLVLIAAPVFVRTTVTVVRFVQDAVEAPAVTVPDAPTTVPTSPPPTFATVPAPAPTPTSPPPPLTTAPPPTTPPQTDLAHAPIRDGSEYRLTVRRVHEQLNEAIGFGRSDYAALDGADGLVESLLGQRPQYDARLRDVIGHIRQARNFADRNAASAAHTIIEEIERELATSSP